MLDRLRAGDVRAADVVHEALDRIRAQDGQINAFTVVLEQQAAQEAASIDAARAAGASLGPLAGLPIAVKDMIWLAGTPATKGSRALRDFVPDADAVAVQRLRAAGAIVVGKTNNPEFGYRGVTENELFGTTRNPVDPDRTPGGSSGGSGAAVAYGAVPMALGSDGGGSIRIPASFCGVAGHKPSDGVIPRGPGFRGWETLSVVGPLAASARDLGVVFDVLAGPDATDERTAGLAAQPEPPDIGRVRIACSADLGFAPVEPGVRAAFANAVASLRRAGWVIEEDAPEPHDGTAMWTEIAVAEGYAADREHLERAPQLLEPDTRRLIEAGADIPAVSYLDALDRRAAYTRSWLRFFDRYDLLLTPMMQMTAFEVGVLAPSEIDGVPVDPFFDDWCAFCFPANLAGLPATTIPCGEDERGLPVGMQIMTRRGADRATLRAAAAFERTFDDLEQP